MDNTSHPGTTANWMGKNVARILLSIMGRHTRTTLPKQKAKPQSHWGNLDAQHHQNNMGTYPKTVVKQKRNPTCQNEQKIPTQVYTDKHHEKIIHKIQHAPGKLQISL